MTNALTTAIAHVAEHGGGPTRVWDVDRHAVVSFGPGTGHPFDGLQATHWSYE